VSLLAGCVRVLDFLPELYINSIRSSLLFAATTRGGVKASPEFFEVFVTKQRVIAYIDGFTLFYSSLKGTRYKWLDLWSMGQSLLLPSQELITVKYFTAQIGAEHSSPDRPFRQKIFLDGRFLY